MKRNQIITAIYSPLDPIDNQKPYIGITCQWRVAEVIRNPNNSISYRFYPMANIPEILWVMDKDLTLVPDQKCCSN